jgi:hypothetical protein
MRSGCLGLLLIVGAGTAVADPATPPPAPAPAPPAPAPASSVLPPVVLLLPPTPPDVPSLRIEAARVASESFENSWRFPDVGPLFGVDGGLWFVGHGRDRPRSGRAAALHGGSIAATLIGEILLQADSPLAGVGAMLTGATLDAAAADSDRNAEARR